MSAMALGLIQGGLSIAGGLARNAAIEDAATKQHNANKLFIERDESVLQEQLQFAATEVGNQAGAALSSLVVQARSTAATVAAQTAETNVYGNLAARKQGIVRMREALQADNIMQAAESKIVDVQTKMKEVKYQTESRHAQNKQDYNNAMTQKQSSFEILANGLSAGISGYSTGMDLMSGMNTLALQTQTMNTAFNVGP